MTAAVLSAVLELLAPEGKMRRYVSFGIASVLLLVLLSPLGELRMTLEALPDLFDGVIEQKETEDSADDAVLSLAEKALADHLAERFSLPSDEILPTLFYGKEKDCLYLRLVLPSWAPRDEIVRYLESETSLVCEVIFGEG